MCRGLALGFRYKADGMPEIIFKGIASHTDTLYDLEDGYLKFEIIVDDSEEDNYAIELDESYYYDDKLDAEVYRIFKNYFTTKKTVKPKVMQDVKRWVKDHEMDVLKALLVNTHYARFSKDQDMRFCKAGRDQNMSSCEAVEDQYFFDCKAGGEQYIAFMHGSNRENNAFMDELSKKNPRLTLNMLLEMAKFAPGEEINRILNNKP